MSTSTTRAEAVRGVRLSPPPLAPQRSSAPLCRPGLTRREAEQLLQWLGANGCPHIELSLNGNRFGVTYWWGAPRPGEGGS